MFQLLPAEGQNLFITAKREGYTSIFNITFQMTEKEMQKIVVSLSPDLGVSWGHACPIELIPGLILIVVGILRI